MSRANQSAAGADGAIFEIEATAYNFLRAIPKILQRVLGLASSTNWAALSGRGRGTGAAVTGLGRRTLVGVGGAQ
jgi:hypothetical protein